VKLFFIAIIYNMPPKSASSPAATRQSIPRDSKTASAAAKEKAAAASTSSDDEDDEVPSTPASAQGGVASSRKMTVTSSAKKEPPSKSSKSSSKKADPHKTDDNDDTPTSPLDAHVRGTDVKWFNDPSYLEPFIMHLRRNTQLAREKREKNLSKYEPAIRQHSVHSEYFNYDECPHLGVSDAEMKHEVNDKRGKAAPIMLILIGGAAVGKSYTIQQMFPNNNATHVDVDEPVMYATAMAQLARTAQGKKRWETGTGNGITQRTFLYHIIDDLIRNGDDIIIDTTGNMKRPIHYCMARAKSAGYKVISIAVYAPMDVAEENCRRRAATTLRHGGEGMIFGSHNPVYGIKDGVLDPSKSLIRHYALKPKFQKKTDLFFLLDNTPGGHIAQTHGDEERRVDGIRIPKETVLCLKYVKPGDVEEKRTATSKGAAASSAAREEVPVTTQLIYINPRASLKTNYYSCRIHQPATGTDHSSIDPSDIIRCETHKEGHGGGNKRTRKLTKNKQTKRLRKNNRIYHKISRKYNH
jgi:hypothetical protein